LSFWRNSYQSFFY